MIIRNQLQTLTGRMQEPRKCIQVLAGPRQVGKTTLITQFVTQCKVPVTSLNADAIEPGNSAWISEQWSVVRLKMEFEHQQEHILIIDEVQKIDNWSEVVKKEWDADTVHNVNIKVVLSGSSRLLLKDGLTESLAGRFELIRVPHWSYQEMHEAFGVTVEEFVYFGGYPGTATYMKNEVRWRRYLKDSIIDPAIDKDVLMTKRILKPALLRQLFSVGASYSGELVSYNKMLGQLTDAGNTATLVNYLQTLDEATLLCGVQKYAVDFARRYQSIPKYQVYNTALYSYYQGRGYRTERLDHTRWGRWVENAVGAHLLNYAAEYGYNVYYWRDHDDEVDFVVSRSGGRLFAIEVKSGRRSDNNGIHVFAEKFKPEKTLVVGNEAFPLELFLSLPPVRVMDEWGK